MLPRTMAANCGFGAIYLITVGLACTVLVTAVPLSAQVPGLNSVLHARSICRQAAPAAQAMTWSRLPASFSNGYEHPITGMVVDPNGILYVSGRADVARSADGGRTWTTLRQGPIGEYIIALGLNSKNEPMIGVSEIPSKGVISYKAVYRYSSRYWRPASGITATRQVSAFALDQAGALIAVTAWHGDVYRSLDDGDNFTLECANIGQDGALWTVALAPDRSLFAGGECTNGIYRSTDNGRSWVSLGLHKADGYKGNIYSIAFTAAGDPLIGRGYDSGTSELQRFTAGHWVTASKGLPPYRNVISLMTAANGDLFAAAPAVGLCGAYRSTDNGATWTDFSNGLPPDTKAQRFAIDKSGNLYVIAHSVKQPSAVYTIKLGQ